VLTDTVDDQTSALQSSDMELADFNVEMRRN